MTTAIGNDHSGWAGFDSQQDPDPGESMAAIIARGTTAAAGAAEKAGEFVTKKVLPTALDTLDSAKRTLEGAQSRVDKKRVGRLLRKLHRATDRVADAENVASQAKRLRKLASGASTALTVVSAASAGYDQYATSSAQTMAGKGLDAAAGAGTAVLFGAALPGISALDAATGGHMAKQLNGGDHAVVALAEGVITGDTRGMEQFRREALDGQHGPVLETAVDSGDYWADNGVSKTLGDFAREVKSLVD